MRSTRLFVGRMLDDCLAENAGTQPSDVPLARRRDALARLTLVEGYIRAHNFIVAMHFKDFMAATESRGAFFANIRLRVDEENYDWGLSFCETIPIGSSEKTTVYKRDKPAPDDVKFFIEFYTMTL
ncbi:hypothetical protein V1478_003731 [Vespula squamosa]|uniref:Uncharacterized protein n=1 Tax=Vespula squamosa TaxID=30214 RepID=A0ABD2BMM6_VESSQ